MKTGKWSQGDTSLLQENYFQHGIQYCATLLDRDITSIKNKAMSLGLKQDRERVRRSLEKPTLNAERYITVTEPEIAYLLGLLWADGCVTHTSRLKTLSIVRHSCRADDGLSFAPIFELVGGWKSFISINTRAIGKNPMLVTHCCNRILAEHMASLGWREKGASPKLVLDTIPKELHHHFFRGYFDGDGCITCQTQKRPSGKEYLCFSIYFSSRGNQDWSFLHELCAELGIDAKVRTLVDKLGTASQFYFNSNTKAEAFCKYLYNQHDGLCLTRKYEKVQALFKYQQVYAESKYGNRKPLKTTP